jgi:hypothetical protein
MSGIALFGPLLETARPGWLSIFSKLELTLMSKIRAVLERYTLPSRAHEIETRDKKSARIF